MGRREAPRIGAEVHVRIGGQRWVPGTVTKVDACPLMLTHCRVTVSVESKHIDGVGGPLTYTRDLKDIR